MRRLARLDRLIIDDLALQGHGCRGDRRLYELTVERY